LNNAKVCPQKWKLSVTVLSRFYYILLTWSPHFHTTVHFLSFFRMTPLQNSREIILPRDVSSICKTAFPTLWKPRLTVITLITLEFQSSPLFGESNTKYCGPNNVGTCTRIVSFLCFTKL
jgi:hypothetical protein